MLTKTIQKLENSLTTNDWKHILVPSSNSLQSRPE
jgi:hypothetical protein